MGGQPQASGADLDGQEGLEGAAETAETVKVDGSTTGRVCVCDRSAAMHVWAATTSFSRGRMTAGQVRLLTVIDEYTRECLAIRAERSIKSVDVIETLAELMLRSGVPEHIRTLTTVRSLRPRRSEPGLAGWEPSTSLHRARLTVGERLCGELQRQAA